MNQSIRAFFTFTPEQFTELQTLIDACNQHDGYMPKVYIDCLHKRSGDLAKDFFCYDGDKLIAYLGAFEFHERELEICTLVHPDYRRQGVLRKLIAETKSLIYYLSSKTLNFPCHHDAVAGKTFLQSLHANLIYSEYTMNLPELATRQFDAIPNPEIDIIHASEQDIPIIASLDQRCFESHYLDAVRHLNESIHSDLRIIWLAKLRGEVIGKIHIYQESQGLGYIHDFCVAPEHQGRGYGSEILHLALVELQKIHFHTISLDVKCHNAGAIKIYQRQGFQTDSIYDFWRVELKDAQLKKLYY